MHILSIVNMFNCFQLLQHTKRIDFIDEFYGLYKVPNTYISGRHRIDFFLATEYISTFIDRSGITSFDKVITSDHRGKFIDLRPRDFLKNILHVYFQHFISTTSIHKYQKRCEI